QPANRNVRQVNNNVATVMPEIGLEDDPISPVNREETVTNKNPNTTINTAPNQFILMDGAAQIAATRARQPKATNFIDKSRSVRSAPERACAAAAPKSAKPVRMPRQISGMERIKLMM